MNFKSVAEITGSLNYAFDGCSNLRAVKFSRLDRLNYNYSSFPNTFNNCTSLTTVSFPMLTYVRANATLGNTMLSTCTGVTVRFPIALQSTIGAWSYVTGGFGGTNTIVLFDIVGTLTGADTNSYTRREYDSTSTAIAWAYNDTVYYTSGTTEPVVGDTIYSDSSCTTSVTTISSIA